MVFFNEKLCALQIAQAEVDRLRRKHRLARRDFRCVEIDKDGHARLPYALYRTSLFSGRIVSEPCCIFHEQTCCMNTNCPHVNWNRGFVDLCLRLNLARQKRNAALRNLFKTR